jgi:uncharacterized protein YqeY
MSLREKMTEDMKNAMRAKDTDRLSIIRMALAKFKESDIEYRLKGLDTTPASELITVLTKMVKQRTESAKMYDDNNRTDAAQKERSEIAVLQEYLPKSLTESEVMNAIKNAIIQTQSNTANDTGKVVAYLKEHYAGQIDFGKIVPTIRQNLGA